MIRATTGKGGTGVLAILLALALLVTQWGLLVHEVNHQLHKPDTPCTACLVVNHFGKAPVTEAPPLHAPAVQSYRPHYEKLIKW
jgi:hypothetical protein